MTSFYDKDFTFNGQPGKRFLAIGKEGNGENYPTGLHPTAHVDLVREKEASNFFMGIPVNATSEGAPTEFFKNRPAQLHGAFSDPSMAAHVPTLLGMAGERSLRDTGRLPMPAKSLSAHSSSMVNKLRDRGVNFPENPENSGDVQTNTIQKQDYLTSLDQLGDVAPTPLREVRSGRDLMRSMLRNTAQGISDKQFGFYNNIPAAKSFVDQHLPGMDPTESPSYIATMKRLGL